MKPSRTYNLCSYIFLIRFFLWTGEPGGPWKIANFITFIAVLIMISTIDRKRTKFIGED